MTFYAGDEYADDDCTSGPFDDYGDVVEEHYVRPAEWADPDAFDAERLAIEDEYDREQSR